MIEDCNNVIIGIGSADKSRTSHNPYTIEQRIQMVRNVFGKRVKVLPLEDIGLVTITDEWLNYILTKIEKLGMPEPTDYYSGSEFDAAWYAHYFKGKYMHIIDRDGNPVPPATELRTSLQLRNNMWKECVPRVNWELVEENYPNDFRVPFPNAQE